MDKKDVANERKRFHSAEMHLKDADEMANCVEHGQTASLGLLCLLKLIYFSTFNFFCYS